MHDPIADPWGPRTPIGRGEKWPERVDHHYADGVSEDDVERWAQSAKDADLLAVVSECHREELRVLKWTTTRIKEAAPQTLSSS